MKLKPVVPHSGFSAYAVPLTEDRQGKKEEKDFFPTPGNGGKLERKDGVDNVGADGTAGLLLSAHESKLLSVQPGRPGASPHPTGFFPLTHLPKPCFLPETAGHTLLPKLRFQTENHGSEKLGDTPSISELNYYLCHPSSSRKVSGVF